MKQTFIPIILSTIWISASEFIRNEFLFKSFWIDHYQNMGLDFPSEPINGAIWGIWSLCFAFSIFIIRKRFTRLETFGLSWWVGFVLMWLVTGNMGVLPMGLLLYAVPLSWLEVFLAIWIMDRFKK